jgi:hypothetical protein
MSQLNEDLVDALDAAEGRRNQTLSLIENLKQELADSKKQNVLLRGWLEMIARSRVGQCDSIAEELFKREAWAEEALAATADLSDCILCDAEPAAFVIEGDQDGHKDLDFLFSVIDQLPVGSKLYKAKEIK